MKNTAPIKHANKHKNCLKEHCHVFRFGDTLTPDGVDLLSTLMSTQRATLAHSSTLVGWRSTQIEITKNFQHSCRAD